MTDRLSSQLKFLAEADKMKSVSRQTMLSDGSREETDAEHSWHFALMALTLFEYCALPGVSVDRVVRMALVHDMVEIYAGDTFAYDARGYADKAERERKAADKLFALLPEGQAVEYRRLWEEFESMETPDAEYANAIDRLQPFMNNYLTNGHTWVKHGVAMEQVYERMEPVRAVLPELWEFIEMVVRENFKKGI